MSETDPAPTYEPLFPEKLMGPALEAVRTVSVDAMRGRLEKLGVVPQGFVWGESPDPLTAQPLLVLVDARTLCTMLEECRNRIAEDHDALAILAHKLDILTVKREPDPEDD